jgi:tetratricopeptide (TPR) repeat protein
MHGLMFFLLLGCASGQSTKSETASLRGTVHDASGSPIADVSLILQNKSSPTTLTTKTDAQGAYSFTKLPAGQYSLRATKKGHVDSDFRSLAMSAGDSETQDFILKLDPVAASEFFDKPEFTVSGVVDTTALGGHGSDTVVRTRESIAKDTVKLGNSGVAPPGMPPEVESLLRAGDYKEARAQVRHLIASSDKPELHHLLADIDEKTGDFLEAVHEYQRAAEMNPSETYLFDWASELLLHHAAEPAEQVFVKGNRLFPKSERMLIGLGSALFVGGSYDQAVETICQASDLNPNDSSAYLFLGRMLGAENISSPVLLDRLHRFITLQPQNAQANYYYAVALSKQNRTHSNSDSEIETLLNNAARLDPNFAPAELQLGILKSQQNDALAAIAHLSRTTQIDPQNQEAHFRLSQLYRKQGQTDKAKQELQTYKELSKKSAEQIDRERREIPQFVYTLRSQPQSQASQ